MTAVEYGQQNPNVILLLHGGGLSWWNYHEVAKILSEQYHVVLPVLDGHGDSDAPFTTIRENAARLISWIDAHFDGQAPGSKRTSGILQNCCRGPFRGAVWIFSPACATEI